MHRTPSGATFFQTYVVIVLCGMVTTIPSGVSIVNPLPEPLVEQTDSSVGSAITVAFPSPPSSVEDEGVDAAEEIGPDIIVVNQPNHSVELEYASSSDQKASNELDRAYLVETATPGWTITLQGPELAIGRLHPEFVHRLAGAIREAKDAGLSAVGIFSAYRPPAFGVGGFSDKFNSLHTYGLAVDMTGIGGPGSADAKLWYEIAARHGVVCPYGFANHVEWNHCQPTRLKIIVAQNPLRETVTANGPIDLGNMFQTGNSYIESAEEVLANSSSSTGPEASSEREKNAPRLSEQMNGLASGNSIGSMRIAKIGHFSREERTETLGDHPSWRRHLHHPSIKSCGTDAATKTQGAHPRQALTCVPRHHTG
jgi:hypothetical protein